MDIFMNMLMHMIKAYIKMFTNCYDFSGRSTRREFWFAVLVTILTAIGLRRFYPYYPSILFYLRLYSIVLFVPITALTVRRLHDTGKSGWGIMLAGIPILGFLLLYYVCLDSGPDNEYGPNPKGCQTPQTKTFTIPERTARLAWTVLGILGCLLAFWNFSSMYSWYDFLGYSTSKKYVFALILACVGCIYPGFPT
jgi:uncharacterized membrane protein YhaH (DUF805 family)